MGAATEDWKPEELDNEPTDACPHCKATDGTWFDRTIEEYSNGEEDGPFYRCNRCGRDVDKKPLDKEALLDAVFKPLDGSPGATPEHDATNPSYYAGLTPDPADTIEGWDLDVWKGNALKYIARAGHKIDREYQTPDTVPFAQAAKYSEIKDLKKAVWYLERRQKVLRKQILDAGSAL